MRRDYREEDLTEAGLKVFTSLDPRVQALGEQALVDELTRLDRQRKTKDGAKLEGAIVVTAPQSGDVIAVIGGREVGFDGFNRALDARRSIGSLAKPMVYLAALETGRYNAATIVMDEPIEVKLARGQVWKPENFTQETYGPVPLMRALGRFAQSRDRARRPRCGREAHRRDVPALGLEQAPEPNPALILGSLDLAPIEVAQLFNSLANGGFRTPLRAVRTVIAADGTALKAFPLQVTPVADPAIGVSAQPHADESHAAGDRARRLFAPAA